MLPVESPFPQARAFTAVFVTWFLAQGLKLIRGGVEKKRLSLYWLWKTGGMPSAHSATVSCLATVTGLYYGFNSIIFLAVLIFTIITMFDAAGVRRNVGRQARILNRMLEDVYEKGQVQHQEQRLKELLGHTPVEVFAGALLGIVMGYLFCGVKW